MEAGAGASSPACGRLSMRIAMGVDSEVTGTPMRPQDIVDDVVRAEAEGFGSAWSVHFSRGVDALGVLAVAGARTSRIDLGVGIVPTYPRHPLALGLPRICATTYRCSCRCSARAASATVATSTRSTEASLYREPVLCPCWSARSRR
jgi:hypothetical protein